MYFIHKLRLTQMVNRITESELKKFCFFNSVHRIQNQNLRKRRVFNSDYDFRLIFDQKNQNLEENFDFLNQNSDFLGENQNFLEF